MKYLEKAPFDQLKRQYLIDAISADDLVVDNDSSVNVERNDDYIKRLVNGEKIPHLIISLFSNNEGYSVGLKNFGNTNGDSADDIIQTMKMSYENEDFLSFIDNEEIPPILIDLIESSDDETSLKLFHSGCIFAEVKDFRRNSSSSLQHCDSCYLCLKPSNLTIINDVNRLASLHFQNNQKHLKPDERMSIEAELVNATAEPLCLDPNPLVGIISTNLHHQKDWLRSSHEIRR